MNTVDLPSSIQDILEEVVQRNGFIDYSVRVGPGAKIGDGFNSQLLSIKVFDNLSYKTLNIVCKTSRNPNEYIFFNREALVYNQLLPILTKFQAEKILLDCDKFLSYPKCYAAVADDQQAQHVMILEDLRAQGFFMRDRAELTPIENIRLITREFGKLHGLSIAFRDQRPDQFVIFKQMTEMYGSVCGRLMRDVFHKHFDCTINSLRNELHKGVMRDLKENYSLYVNECVSSEASEQFLVFSHGDLWNNNVMYKYAEDGELISTRFLDWQQARYGSLALDLVYFIFSATDRDIRDKEYENLLQLYYESLRKTVTLLGSNTMTLFTLEDLKAEMKRCGNFVLAMMPILIYGSAAHQMVKIDSATAFDIGAQLEYERRMNEVVEDIIEQGFHRKITSID